MTDEIDRRQVLREVSGLWWLTLLLGVLGIVAGIIVLARPDKSLAAIAVVAGIFVLVDGIFTLIAVLRDATASRGLATIVGALDLVIGVLLIRHPINSVTAIALFMGIWLIAAGAVRLVAAFETPWRRTWHVVLACVEILAGIVIVSSPHIGVATLALFVGLSLIVNGAALAALGVVLRSAGKSDGFSGSPPFAAA